MRSDLMEYIGNQEVQWFTKEIEFPIFVHGDRLI